MGDVSYRRMGLRSGCHHTTFQSGRLCIGFTNKLGYRKSNLKKVRQDSNRDPTSLICSSAKTPKRSRSGLISQSSRPMTPASIKNRIPIKGFYFLLALEVREGFESRTFSLVVEKGGGVATVCRPKRPEAREL